MLAEVPCHTCDGLEEVRCRHCRGTGTWIDPLATREFRERYPIPERACRHCNGRGWVLCPTCLGVGTETVVVVAPTVQDMAARAVTSRPSELSHRNYDTDIREVIFSYRDRQALEAWKNED